MRRGVYLTMVGRLYAQRGVPSMVVGRLYAQRGVPSLVYLPICLLVVPTLVYLPIYTLYTPGYTTVCTTPVLHGYVATAVRGREAPGL